MDYYLLYSVEDRRVGKADADVRGLVAFADAMLICLLRTYVASSTILSTRLTWDVACVLLKRAYKESVRYYTWPWMSCSCLGSRAIALDCRIWKRIQMPESRNSTGVCFHVQVSTGNCVENSPQPYQLAVLRMDPGQVHPGDPEPRPFS